MQLEDIAQLSARVRANVARVIVGQHETVDRLLAALLCEGHVLIEGPPGVAKTLLAHAFAASLELGFARIQFTPDLMPADVVGTNLFNFQSNQFTLIKGPVFTDLLLGDEINRAPPKTQSALLEAMQERAVTIDGTSHALSAQFMVIATENPIEQEGTYPLPEAQLDRFLFKLLMGYPSREEEQAVVRLHGQGTAMPRLEKFALERVADRAALAEARACIAALTLGEPIIAYIVDLVRATREHSSLMYGASPRASVMLGACARAQAALQGRPYVIPDDVKAGFIPALRHRVILSPAAEIEARSVEHALAEILQATPAPR